jgi:DNA-binding NarL/FixJ family response regulator
VAMVEDQSKPVPGPSAPGPSAPGPSAPEPSAPRPPARRIRILIVEGHPVLSGVARLACEASPNLEVVGESGGGYEALAACAELEPDVLVLDLSLPDLDGLEVARRLRTSGSEAKILVLTGRTDYETVFESVRAGVDGYLEKTAGVRSIVDAIQKVARGERVFTPEQERGAVSELGRMARQAREASGLRENLTPRELEILGYVSYGLTVKQVATRLGLSPRTVESHIGKLYRKLGVSNRVQAVSRASSLGLIELG